MVSSARASQQVVGDTPPDVLPLYKSADMSAPESGNRRPATDGPLGKVLVLSLDPGLAMSGRILRQVESLAADYHVVVAAHDRPEALNGVDFVELPSDPPRSLRRSAESALRAGLRVAGRYRLAYWLDANVRRWKDTLQPLLPVDAILVNDLYALPLARALIDLVIFDAHEHWTSESASWTNLQKLSMRGAHDWIVDHYVPQTAAMMTVSPGIAHDYELRTGVRPCLITNAPRFQSLHPSRVTEPIRLLHVGVSDERRRLEDTIEAVRLLNDRFVLDIVLARDNQYRRRLERLVASDSRIRLLPPVPQSDVVSFANSYDVGVFLLPGQFPNQVHVLPNKLFDYIQARLAVAIGPSPAMVKVVDEWDCGVVSSSFAPEAFAESLGRLTIAEIERMKCNSDRAAHVLTADKNREVLVSLVQLAIAGARSSA